MQRQTIDVAGRAIQVARLGSAAPTILLVHGFGADHMAWMFNILALARAATVVAIDLPGHGASSRDVGAGDVGSLAAVIAGAMDALGLDAVHLVGHSLGGAAALRLALDRPERLRALTLIAPVGLGPDINAAFVDGFVAMTDAEATAAVLRLLVAKPQLVSKTMIDAVLAYRLGPGVAPALARIVARCFPGGRQQEHLRDRLGGLSVPAQVIWGADDQVIPVEHASGLPAALPVHVLPGIGHLPHMEAAAEVNRLIAAF